MTDIPTRGPLQPHDPGLMNRIAVEEAKERAQRNVGAFRYSGPKFAWMGPEECVYCGHSVSVHQSGQCWTVNGIEANDSDCECSMTNLDSE